MCKCFGWVGENREGMEAGAMLDRGWWCGYLCRSAKGATKEITGEDYNK